MNRQLISADILLSLFFIIGGILGLSLVLHFGVSPLLCAALRDYFCGAVNGMTSPVLLRVVAEFSFWPTVTAIFGFSRYGIFGIPALLFSKAFLLVHASSSIISEFGVPGIFLSLSLFGASAFLLLPVLFLVCLTSFRVSLVRFHSFRTQSMRASYPFGVLFFAAAVILLCVILQCTVIPVIFQKLCTIYF